MYFCQKERGFTLIEVLVIVVIIAILAAILLPVFATARMKAQSAACQSNLVQIGQAFSLYLQDYDGCYPNTNDPFLWMGRRWRWVIMPYLASDAEEDPNNKWQSKRNNARILLCPSDTKAPVAYDNTSYAYSMAFYHTVEQINSLTRIEQTWTENIPCVTWKQHAVKYPSKKVLVAEWLSNHEMPHVGWNSWKGGRNYLFADYHCKYLKATQINKANDGWPDINLTRDGILGKDID